MQIIYKKTFEKQLLHIVNYIAKDKISASINFARSHPSSVGYAYESNNNKTYPKFL